jgi:hypothetical protein
MPFSLELSDFWVPKQGPNAIRILPPHDPDQGEFFLEVPTHYDVTPQCRALICQKMTHRTCIIERYMAHLLSSRERDSQERALRMKPVNRIQMNIHPLKESRVKIWSVSSGTLQKILSLIVDEGYGNLTHYSRGHDLRVTRTGEGSDTRYTFHVRPNPTSIKLPGWLDQLYDLTAHFRPPSDAEVWDILRGHFVEP